MYLSEQSLPVNFRFDYSDVSFGNTHSQGATVAITCTAGGQPATVEGFDQVSDGLFW